MNEIRAHAAVDDLVVLWLERAADGTAAGQHLRGTLARVDASTSLKAIKVVADRSSPDGSETLAKKFLRILRLVCSGAMSARRSRTLLARHHPLLFPVVLVWRMFGGAIVLSVQGSLDDVANEYPSVGASRTLRQLSIWSTKRAHVLIAGAPVLRDHIVDHMASRGTPVLPLANGVFVAELARASLTPRPMASDYAVFVGNLASWQGIDVMVAAVSSPEWPRGLPLVVVGDGVERGTVEGAPGVTWQGRLPSAEAARWYAHAVCAISMKRSDVAVGAHGYWPFKLIESAAVGVPIVCSDAPGMREAGDRLGNAVIVPGRDAAACAAAVGRLHRESALRSSLIQRGKASVSEYDWAAGSDALSEAVKTAKRRRNEWRA